MIGNCRKLLLLIMIVIIVCNFTISFILVSTITNHGYAIHYQSDTISDVAVLKPGNSFLLCVTTLLLPYRIRRLIKLRFFFQIKVVISGDFHFLSSKCIKVGKNIPKICIIFVFVADISKMVQLDSCGFHTLSTNKFRVQRSEGSMFYFRYSIMEK